MKRMALIFRLAFAWNKKARTSVRRSVGARYAKRKPRKGAA